jgi:hypothetical protein
MSCAHCKAVEQRGRYCVGCGKLLPPSQLPPRRIRVAARPPYPLPEDATQPVLRFRVNPRRPLPVEEATAASV